MDDITTPEAEMDVDLPPLSMAEQEGNASGKAIRMEIPDSEEISEFSSPVKISREEKRDEVAERAGGVQIELGVAGQNVERGDGPKFPEMLMRTEVPDSEKPSDFSSPSKVAVFTPTSKDETLRGAGGLEMVGESLEETINDGDATMIDVAPPVLDDGMAEGEASRAAGDVEADEGKGAVTKTGVDNAKEMDHNREEKEGLLLAGDKAAQLERGILAAQTHTSPTNPSPRLDHSKDLEQETSTKPKDIAVGLLSTPVNEAEAAVERAAIGSDIPASSPVFDPQEIAIAARNLLAEEVSPTVSDVTERTDQPKSFKSITAIPDSDEDEDDKLPDAPAIQYDDMQIPASNPDPVKNFLPIATTKPAAMETVSEIHTTSSEVSQPAILEQGQKREIATFPTSSDHGTSKNGSTLSFETSSSPIKPAMAPPTKKKDGGNFTTKKQAPQSAENRVAAELTSSSLKSQEATKPHVTSLEQFATSTIDKSSQVSDIPSSPLDTIKGGSFKTKRKESPNASFTAPEAPETKDVVMAELKAMKIASIQNRISALEIEIANKRTKLEEVTKDLKQPASETVKRHIKLLHDYNDIRDVGQGLVGMIADNRGVRIGELYEEFGVGLKD